IWTFGTHATLVGLPTKSCPKGTNSSSTTNDEVTFAAYPSQTTLQYYAPTSFNGNFGDNAAPQVLQMRTFLDFKFNSTGQDAGRYPPFPATAKTQDTPDYGPSSGHPAVVNHLYIDGSVHSLRKDIDVAAYMFVITRNGGDPYPPID
ncbi:MAG: H-X9-DG-CTERM domain-containing protein, partial [Thermoguttaceae bacterium]